MAKQKDKRASKAVSRVVYSEFGQSPAVARAVPDRPPAEQDLRVQVSGKGRKGKKVTIISGFQHSSDTLAKLAKTLKTQCGSGGTVKDNTIEIQGEHAPKLVELLMAMGYRAKRSGG
ncbi:MAG: translation initiation factor [Symploca sp. SIO2G7]|nr:translation initiation factor [Symploca sp. SIO2G7]